jgi:hypothetical protein
LAIFEVAEMMYDDDIIGRQAKSERARGMCGHVAHLRITNHEQKRSSAPR